MRILIFFMESVFKNHVHGGSTVILKSLTNSLSKGNNKITILCRSRATNNKPFKLNKNTIVKPILRFKEVFPDAYCTPPYNIANAIRTVKEYSEHSDIFINFDSNFIFQDIFHKHDLRTSTIEDSKR